MTLEKWQVELQIGHLYKSITHTIAYSLMSWVLKYDIKVETLGVT